jgi:prepilin-type N-terminal cleavage/methylation domain-containing protein
MRMQTAIPTSLRARAGFSMVELLVALLVSSVLLIGVFQLVFAQNSAYSHQQGTADARQSLRAAGTLLAWELRHLSAAGGDLYALAADSVSVRSFDATAVVCRKRVVSAQYGLHSVAGEIEVGDSAMLYIVNGNRPADDAWRAVAIQNANTPAGLGMLTTCPSWPGTPAIQLGIQVGISATADTAGLRIGAPVRAFRRRTYRMIEQNGDWWLGMREGAGAYQLMTGPLRSGNGLVLRYTDAAGANTTVAANVRAIEFILRSESQLARTVDSVHEDSVVMRVQLRG